MERYDVVLNTKGIRKVAFAAGFGFFMGKAVATAIDTFVWKAIEHQNQEDSSTDNDKRIKMGFHM